MTRSYGGNSSVRLSWEKDNNNKRKVLVRLVVVGSLGFVTKDLGNLERQARN